MFDGKLPSKAIVTLSPSTDDYWRLLWLLVSEEAMAF